MKNFTYNRLAITLLYFFGNVGFAQDVFNLKALELDNPGMIPADLSQFSVPGGQLPGIYHVDILINGEKKDTRDVKFIKEPSGDITPELTIEQLSEYGVKIDSIKSLSQFDKNKIIAPLNSYISDSTIKFDFPNQMLKITIPQSQMETSARGYIPPQLWDEGIPALLASYDFTGSNTNLKHGGGGSDNYFLNLHSGLNAGAWRIRNYSTWNYNKDEKAATESKWDSINTWAQRDIKNIKGQLVIGDTFTSSDIFDSVQFKGIQLISDDNMLPDSQRGFAPVIRGIANSNARVTVKQNNSVIYQSYVPPGAFVIDDLYPTSAGGDLNVTITESDGSERNFTQAFSNVPVMQRMGRLKYAYTVGKYRSSYDNGNEPDFGQITMLYGLSNRFTLYGGSQYSEQYQSFSFGVGTNLEVLGSISIDATNASADLENNENDSHKEGQSYRFQYMKNFDETDSTLSLAGYRYSTSGYYSFADVNDLNSDIYSGQTDDDAQYQRSHNKKNKIQLNFTQEILDGEWGSFSVNGYQQSYWQTDGYERNLTLGYNNSISDISFGINYTYSDTPYSDSADQQLAFNMSIPLSHWMPRSNTYVNYNSTSSRHGDTVQQLGLSGTALAGDNLSYSAMQGYNNQSRETNGQLSANYKGSYGNINTGYNYDHDSRQINYGLQGSIVAHQYGVTLSQPVSGDMTAIALVRAPGAKNVNVINNTGVATDWRGYTIVPYVNSYRRTNIRLDTESFANDTDIDNTVYSIVPTAGAVVVADYKTHTGNRALFTVKRSDGSFVPFGATVTLSGDDRESIVNDDGQVYLTGLKETGTIHIAWGKGDANSCLSEYDLSNGYHDGGVDTLTLQCSSHN